MRDVEDKLRKLAPISKGAAEASWLLYLASDLKERKAAAELIDLVLYQAAGVDYERRIVLDPPPPAECQGPFHLGEVMYPPDKTYAPFGLREDDWIKHVLIVGMSGMGKTNLVFHMLGELRRHQKPFLIFDWKRNYRDLSQLPTFRDLVVFTVGKREPAPFHFNPLIPPPGTPAGEWLVKLVDVLKHAYFVGEGVELLLREALDWAYSQCGWYEDGEREAPTFHLVKYKVQRRRAGGREMLWKASAMRVLEALCFKRGLGPVLNTSSPWDHERLLNLPVVLELDALSDSDKVFITEALVLWLYEFRKNERERERFRHALVIEEAHHVLSEKKERNEGVETVMETCLRQIREFGESVIAIDQEPSKLSNSIKANTHTKIVFNLGNDKDLLELRGPLGLRCEECRGLNGLAVGEAIASIKQRVPTPVLLRVPHIQLVKGRVDDRSIRGLTGGSGRNATT